jgi:hypothetical protein
MRRRWHRTPRVRRTRLSLLHSSRSTPMATLLDTQPDLAVPAVALAAAPGADGGGAPASGVARAPTPRSWARTRGRPCASCAAPG